MTLVEESASGWPYLRETRVSCRDHQTNYDAAKANVAAVNYHFGSKRKLYLEVLRLALPDFRGVFHAIPGSSPKEELRLFISNVFSSMLGVDRPRWL